jgi:hypothetical protein
MAASMPAVVPYYYYCGPETRDGKISLTISAKSHVFDQPPDTPIRERQ